MTVFLFQTVFTVLMKKKTAVTIIRYYYSLTITYAFKYQAAVATVEILLKGHVICTLFVHGFILAIKLYTFTDIFKKQDMFRSFNDHLQL